MNSPLRKRTCEYFQLFSTVLELTVARFLKFLSYFQGPILYGELLSKCPALSALITTIVMELAVVLAAGLRDWIDFGVIIAILLLNAGVGWYQEKQAADVVASLKGDIAMRATVVRNGQEEEIKARELVPGDIVSFFSTSFLVEIDVL